MQSSAPGSLLGALHQAIQARASLPGASLSSRRLRLALPRSQHLQHLMQAQPTPWGVAPCHQPTLTKLGAVLQWHAGWQMRRSRLSQGQLQQQDKLLHKLPNFISPLLARQQMLGAHMVVLQEMVPVSVLGKLLLLGRIQLLSLSTAKQRQRMEPQGRVSMAGACLRRPQPTWGCPRACSTASHPTQLLKVSLVWPSDWCRFEMRLFFHVTRPPRSVPAERV